MFIKIVSEFPKICIHYYNEDLYKFFHFQNNLENKICWIRIRLQNWKWFNLSGRIFSGLAVEWSNRNILLFLRKWQVFVN